MSKKRILIVDDEPGLQLLGKALLGAQGYEVLGALDGFEGLAKPQVRYAG